MEETFQALLALQELDRKIREKKRRVTEFEPELETVDAPVAEKKQEVDTLRKRLDELRTEIRRLERGAEDKRARLKKYEDRMERIRNAREEAALRTEMDLIRKAAEADEDEAVSMMEQATRTELKLDEAEEKLEGIRAEAEPRRKELIDERDSIEGDLQLLRDQRQNQLVRLDDRAATLYERVSGGKTDRVLASLTPDGACGHCFSLIPIQQQNEIRQARALYRCEACGVILYSE